jgi:uncharacterized membrane protein
MRTLLSGIESAVVWGLFFATTVYGHVALKVAAGSGETYNYRQVPLALSTVWGWTAMAAWAISGLLWILVLTKSSVLAANSVASLRYVLICAAASLFLHEKLQIQQGVGMLLVAAGIWLLNR